MWASEELFFDGDSYFASMLQGISKAKLSVDLECYIFKLDKIGAKTLLALERASKRGILVRLLLDGFGSRSSVEEIRKRLHGSDIEFRVYHELHIPWRMGLSRWLERLNRRNHRKSCIVDGHRAWVGSFNVSEVHCHSSRPDRPWRDTGVCVAGGDVQHLLQAFERAWCPSRPRSRWLASNWVRLNDPQSARRSGYEAFLRRICRARKRVWLTTPYFVPTRRLLKALSDASCAGADVRLLVPGHSDIAGMRSLTGIFFGLLAASSVSVYLYRPSILHAKVALIDEWASVGSSNLNHRSLLHDLEVDLVFRKARSLKTLEEKFLTDLSHSQMLSADFSQKRSLLERSMGALGFQFRHWL